MLAEFDESCSNIAHRNTHRLSGLLCNPVFQKIVALAGMSVSAVLCLITFAFAQPISRPIPVLLPSRDTTVSSQLPQLPDEIAGSHGALHLDSIGHIIASDGSRLRFFGTSLDLTAAFLSGSDARTLARRLRKLGFNAVKFVYNDYFGYDDASFFRLKDSTGKTSGSSYLVNPPQFAKFDTLMYELKRSGIYAFVMLNTFHYYGKGEGVQYPDSCYSGSTLFQFFDAGAAALQRTWARTFLSHTNPLTGLRLADDLQLAVLECDQEQSLYYYWTLGRLNYIDDLNKLTKGQQTVSYFQSKFLDSAYNLFLKHKYATDQGVLRAWVGGPVSPLNLMDNGSFENPASPAWAFVARDAAVAYKVDADGGVDSSVYEKLRITSLATNASPSSITFTNLSARLGRDSLYEISFWAKMGYSASRPSSISRNIGLAVYLYALGTRSLTLTQKIDTSWKKYSVTFRCMGSGEHYVQFQLGAELGDVWLDAVSTHRKAETGLLPTESIVNATVQRLLFKNLNLVPLQRIRDQVQFLDSLQQNFYRSMEIVIKDTMHFKGLVNYTQNNYWYSLPDVYTASGGDVAEYHSGWDYLGNRPGKSYTDSTWMVRNTSMVRSTSAGTLGSIAANSRSGKAFVLGEYSMPWPNQYLSEQMVLLSAYAAYQDWDGLFITPFAFYRDDLFADSLRNPFHAATNVATIASNPAVLSLAPSASKLFREALVRPADVVATLRHDPDDLWLSPTYSRGSFWVDGRLDNNVVPSLGVRQHFGDTAHYVAARYNYLADTATKHTDTGELAWDETNGLFTIEAASVEGGTGFFGSDTLRLRQLSISRKDAARDILSFYLMSLDSLPLARSQKQLLTLSTRAQNSGLVWIDSLGFGKNWGTAPIVISAATVILRLRTTFDSTFIQPLDGRGQPTGNIVLMKKVNDSTASITIDQQQTPSVWYQITQRNGTARGVLPIEGVASKLTLTMNPASGATIAAYTCRKGEHVLFTLVDDLGRVWDHLETEVSSSGVANWKLDLAHVASGHYLVRASRRNASSVAHLSVVK